MNDINKKQDDTCQLDLITENHEKTEITLNTLENILAEKTHTTCGDYNL